MSGSRIPGFSSSSVEERRRLVAEFAGLDRTAVARALEGGGLDAATADKVVENVVGTYSFPLSVCPNLTVNGVDRLAPMVTEEPSVVAAASNAAKMVRAGGGFQAEMQEELMTAQVQLFDVPDLGAAARAIEDSRERLLARGATAVPRLVQRGGGPRGLEVRVPGEGMLVVHVHVECVDAMGANLVNAVAEALAPDLAALTRGQVGLRILSNLCDRRVVRVRCWVPRQALVAARGGEVTAPGGDLAAAIERASRFAECDPYRAATHNKGIMNGVDAVVLASGNDWRATEAGAHAYAARDGRYRPLAVWRREGTDLRGELAMPLALGTVGGMQRNHPAARLALRIAGVERARELSELAACVGMASNLAALRALAAEGIQRGHMALHARSIAVLAGACDREVEQVAAAIVRARAINLDCATTELLRLRERAP